MTSSDASNIKLDMQPQVVEEIELGCHVYCGARQGCATNEAKEPSTASAEIHARARKYYETIGFASVLFLMFTVGWNDGTQGPLLPAIQATYHVSTVVAIEGQYAILTHYSPQVGFCRRIHNFCVLLRSMYPHTN